MSFIDRSDFEIKEKRFLGFYVAEVVSNNDPVKLSRVKIRIKGIHDGISNDNLPWAAQVRPVFLGGSNSFGTISIPKVGTSVLVVFDKGDPYSPLYLGELVSSSSNIDLSKKNYTSRHGWTDGEGNFDFVDMKEEKRSVEVKKILDMKIGKDTKIESGKTFTVEVGENTKVTSGETITLKTENFKVEAKSILLTADSIVIEGSSVDFVKK